MNLVELDYDEKLLAIQPEVILKEAKPFMELMMECKCALMEIETKLNVLNAEFALNTIEILFESIKSRIKSPTSIVEKLKRKGFPLTVESIVIENKWKTLTRMIGRIKAQIDPAQARKPGFYNYQKILELTPAAMGRREGIRPPGSASGPR